MPVINFLKSRHLVWQQKRAKQEVLRRTDLPSLEITRPEWRSSLTDPTDFYLRCFYFFHFRIPDELKRHRAYFSKARRGFGEDAFHSMWLLLFQEFQPVNFLEIGVYRGQVLSLISLLQKNYGKKGEVSGISPFSSTGDSVSRYRQDVDYLEDTLANFKYFSLPKPELVKALSTDETALKFISSRPWDCIYIDGNHDYDIAKLDWENCSKSLTVGGLVVLDDSGLTTNYRPPIFSTAGHPGPSRLAQEIDRTKFQEILQVGHNRVFQKI